MMRATSIGHAGILVEAEHGSIVCDPWFVPAFLGAWFPFPRNDQLDDELVARIESADHLYVSHLHGDHWDEPWLRDHLPRDINVLLPGYPTRELERNMRRLGFSNLTTHGRRRGARPRRAHRRHPRRDQHHRRPRRRLGARRRRRRGPHRRPERLPHHRPRRPARPRPGRPALAAVQRRHLVPDGVRAPRRTSCSRSCGPRWRASWPGRCATSSPSAPAPSCPSAGPPCFLDPELYHLNVVRGDEPSIFVDQRTFLDRLADSGHHGILAVPGTTIEVTADKVAVHHPVPDAEVDPDLHRQGRPPPPLPGATGSGGSTTSRPGGAVTTRSTCSPTCRRGGTRCWRWRRRCAPPSARRACCEPATSRCSSTSRPARCGRSPASRTATGSTSTGRSSSRSSPPRAVDWSNSLFLSCRFRAWRDGEFNEWVYNFFKSLSVERMRRTEAEAVRRLDPPTETEPDIELDGWIVQRRCPHRNADLSVFGEVDGLHADVHAARLALRPGDRALPHRRRPPPPGAPPRSASLTFESAGCQS